MPRVGRHRVLRTIAALWLAALLGAACSTDDTRPGLEDDAEKSTGGIDRTSVIGDDALLPLDPDVTTGALDNGLTYYLRSNDAPGDSVTIRLVVDAGARQQAAPDDGVAHFLEHMLFNGTQRWPGNELDRVLQTIGAGIGPDLNAYTSLDETVYELTVTTVDPAAVATAFTVMAEWTRNATIEPSEVIAERGIVRDEYRQQVENPDGAIANEIFVFYLEQTPYEGRMPLGTPGRIETMEATALRSFYETWYHPENMAIVAVGDLSIEQMRRELERAFDEIHDDDEPPPRPSPIAVDPDPAGRVAVATHPGLVASSLSVDWLRPPSDPATIGGARLDLIDDLIASMLEHRLDTAYRAGTLAVDRAPFFERFAVARHLTFFGTNLRGPDLAVAYADLLGHLESAAIDGFTSDELATAVTARHAALDAWETSLGTTQDFAWTDGYVAHFLTGTGGEAPQATIERERAVLAEVTLQELSARWMAITRASGPITVAIGPSEGSVPSVEELRMIGASVAPIAPPIADEIITTLMARPTPTKPVDGSTVDGIYGERHVWYYGNGVTVVFEPSPIAEGSLELTAEGRGGASTLEPDDYPLAALAARTIGESGVGKVSSGQLRQFLDGTTVVLRPFIGDYLEGFDGSASTADGEVLFQLLHLAITAPQADPVAFAAALADAEQLLDLAEIDPEIQAVIALRRALYGSDRYSGLLRRDQLDTVTSAQLLTIYRQRLGVVDDLVVSIVGDQDAETIRFLADHYLGTLPSRPVDTFGDLTDGPVETIERVEIPLPDGFGDGGVVLRWTPVLEVDESTLATAAVLNQIVDTEIFDTAREELGASYGGSAAIISNNDVPSEGFEATVTIDGDPARVDEVASRILTEIDRLRTDGPEVDEFDRARTLLRDRLVFITNQDLLLANLAEQRGHAALSADTRLDVLDQVTADDVRRLARVLFDPDAYIDIRRR